MKQRTNKLSERVYSFCMAANSDDKLWKWYCCLLIFFYHQMIHSNETNLPNVSRVLYLGYICVFGEWRRCFQRDWSSKHKLSWYGTFSRAWRDNLQRHVNDTNEFVSSVMFFLGGRKGGRGVKNVFPARLKFKISHRDTARSAEHDVIT